MEADDRRQLQEPVVQTGIGRTGTLLCSEQYHIRPNIITLAKGLGGGLPIGAVLMNEVAGEILGPGQHGSTFGGNPGVCAVGVEVPGLIIYGIDFRQCQM